VNKLHLKKVVRRKGKFFTEHYIIVDAIDGSTTTYEELHVKNYVKYLPQIIRYLLEHTKGGRIKASMGILLKAYEEVKNYG